MEIAGCVETQLHTRSSLRLSMHRTHLSQRNPESAPAQVLESFQNKYKRIGTAREKEAMRYRAIQHAAR
jgi:hypothetical protein